MKLLPWIVFAITLMVLVSAAPSDHTRWNDQFDTCFYFYQLENGKDARCYVPDQYCIIEPNKPDWFRSVDTRDCWHRVSVTNATVSFTITPPPNQAPIIGNLENIIVIEGAIATIAPTCTDPEKEKTTLRITGKMKSTNWATGYGDAGSHTITVICTDVRGTSSSANITVTVVDTNRAPLFRKPA